ncbi:roadblock/LC7 domain-containing protein [candidate division TA06 bacterium]|nr:roadblock/LC7 domain-containing protein [candidate division TA06 bacterium]
MGGVSLFQDDFRLIHQSLEKLQQRTQANAILLIDRAGQLITSVGKTDKLDITSFASLSAADFAATKQLAALIGEEEFSDLFHEGERENIYVSMVDSKVILVVLFDKRSTLGLVRVRATQISKEISEIFQNIYKKLEEGGPTTTSIVDAEFTREAEEEIDNLFK